MKQIGENMAKQSGGSYTKKRYIEFIEKYENINVTPEKTSDQIIAETIAKMGLKKA